MTKSALVLGGYVGKLLRVDLTNETVKEQNLPSEDILRKYVGCFGLGLRILYDEVPPNVNPLDPENLLVFMTGPLTGTIVPAPTNVTAVTINYATGFTAGRSHSHGYWGPNLKFAGYDGIILQGAAENPVYLWIHEGTCEVRDAGKIWGRDTHDSEDLVKQEIAEPSASVAVIGPAGESLCAGALIENDKYHSFSHSGVGGVMGSKKLKAIAVYGTGKVPLVNGEQIRAAAREWSINLFKSDITRGQHEIPITKYEQYDFIKEESLLAYKNLKEVGPLEWSEDFDAQKFTAKPCFQCSVACSYNLEIGTGPHKGEVATVNGGGENLEGAAAIMGISETGTVYHMVELFDRLGFEGSETGCAMAMAFECYEKGLLTKRDTGGLELKWGDAEVAEKLLRTIAKREGLGDILAKGVLRAAEIIGGDAPQFAVHIKGAGMSLHDWRPAWGVLLGQIVGGAAGWPAPGADCWAAEPDAGYPRRTDPFDYKTKPEEVRRTGMKKYWEDSIGTCWFACWGVPGVLAYASQALSGATGWDFKPEEAFLVGERTMNLERMFNVRRGLTPSDDFDVSSRILEAPTEGKAKGKSIKPYLKGMVTEYYRLMGWDERTGRPWASTLRRLGLDDNVDDVWT